MDVGGEQAHQLVRLALCKELDWDLLARVDRMHAAQILVEGGLNSIYKRLETACVEEMNRLWRQVDPLLEARFERVGNNEIAKQRGQVEQRGHYAAGDRGLIAAETAPEQSHLRGGESSFLGG